MKMHLYQNLIDSGSNFASPFVLWVYWYQYHPANAISTGDKIGNKYLIVQFREITNTIAVLFLDKLIRIWINA